MNPWQHLEKVRQKSSRLWLGLMSGTSLDGLDIALVEVSGSGSSTKISLKHTFNQNQIEWFKAGSALNLIASQNEK